jgi:hypothetical protein
VAVVIAGFRAQPNITTVTTRITSNPCLLMSYPFWSRWGTASYFALTP